MTPDGYTELSYYSAVESQLVVIHKEVIGEKTLPFLPLTVLIYIIYINHSPIRGTPSIYIGY